MSLRNNKMAVLRQLGIESEPISLPDLMLNLGENFKERSVRRWLKLLIEEGSVKKIGQKRGTKYFVTGRLEDSSLDISNCFSSSSLQAIKKIKKPLFDRKPIAYNDQWFESYKPNSSYYLSEDLQEQLLLSGKRTSEQDPSGTYAHQIFNRLIIDLSYNSSRLEGNTYSLLDTEKLLIHGDIAEGKLDKEKVMILNHKEAIRYLVDNISKIEVTQNVICTLHYLLSDGLVEPFEAGKVRKNHVRIGGSTYIPFENSQILEFQLKKIATKSEEIKNPFEKSIFLLIHISYLQAFVDVNKRTARLAANIPLIRSNLVPLAFNDVRIEDYIFAMITIYELQDVQPIVDLYVYSYLRTCAAYDSTVKSMGFDEIRVRYRQQRREFIREIILQKFSNKKTKKFLEQEIPIRIPEEEREEFLEDILEDLDLIDESRIAGLGITMKSLQAWKELYNQ